MSVEKPFSIVDYTDSNNNSFDHFEHEIETEFKSGIVDIREIPSPLESKFNNIKKITSQPILFQEIDQTIYQVNDLIDQTLRKYFYPHKIFSQLNYHFFDLELIPLSNPDVSDETKYEIAKYLKIRIIDFFKQLQQPEYLDHISFNTTKNILEYLKFAHWYDYDTVVQGQIIIQSWLYQDQSQII